MIFNFLKEIFLDFEASSRRASREIKRNFSKKEGVRWVELDCAMVSNSI